MYYLFFCESYPFGRKLISANIIGQYPLVNPYDWASKEFNIDLGGLTFEIKDVSRLPDYVYTEGGLFELVSSRMIETLNAYSVNHISYPTIVRRKGSGEVVSELHRILRLTDTHLGIDERKSLVNRPVATKDLYLSQKVMFRDKNRIMNVVVRDDLKSALESNNITGCRFEPILDYENAPSLFNW